MTRDRIEIIRSCPFGNRGQRLTVGEGITAGEAEGLVLIKKAQWVSETEVMKPAGKPQGRSKGKAGK